MDASQNEPTEEKKRNSRDQSRWDIFLHICFMDIATCDLSSSKHLKSTSKSDFLVESRLTILACVQVRKVSVDLLHR